MKTVIIVQARMTSSRLPGKVLLPLGERTVLGQVLYRCQQIVGVDSVCCAIPTGAIHDVLVREAKQYKAIVYRGSEEHVLERYYHAALALQADIVMRITSDCPLISPEVCSQVLKAHKESAVDYTSNNMPPSWPHGWDCEVFHFKALEKAYYDASLDEEKEHVTPWIRKHLKTQNVANPKGNFYHLRVTLDTEEDYGRIQKIIQEEISLERTDGDYK